MKSFNFRLSFLLPIFLVLFSFNLYAVELVNEQFDSNIDGWTVSDNSKVYWTSNSVSNNDGSMFIDRKDWGKKLYSLGTNYANQTITVSINWCATNQWESNNDYLRVKVNGVTEHTDYDGGGCQSTSFDASADSTGNFEIEFSPRTNNDNEDAYIQGFTLSVIPPSCNTLRDSDNLTSANNTYTNSSNYNDSAWNVGPGSSGGSLSRAYYFTVDGKGTVDIDLTRIDNDQARFSVSKSACPTSLDNLTSTQLDFSAAGDFYVYIYYVDGGNSNIEHQLDVVFTPHVPPTITPATFEVYKGASIDTLIGTVLAPTATSFSINSGNIDDLFKIDDSGNIDVKSIIEDHNTTSSYILEINATNAYGSNTGNITINITDTYFNETEGEGNFTKRISFFTRGELVSVGNAFVVAPENDTSTADCSTYTNGDYIDPVRKNNKYRRYCHYNVDGVQGSAATTAELNIPEGSTIKWAGLYWQALTHHRDTPYNTMSIDIRRDGGTYQTASANDIHHKLSFSTNISPVGSSAGATSADIYSAFADVTKTFQDQNWADGNYTVRTTDVLEGQEGSFGVYGAWNLVVVYANEDKSYKSFTIFDGWKQVSGSNSNVPVPISGFYTPKSTPINAKLAVFAAEGDYNINGDKLSGYRKSNDEWHEFLNDNNPDKTNQTFSALVQTSGARDPSQTNNNGIDIQIFDIGTGTTANLLQTEQTSIDFKFTSSGDLYFPSMLAFATEVYVPTLCYDYGYSQYGRSFTSAYDPTAGPKIIGTVRTGVPIDVSIYIRNKEDSDIDMKNMTVDILKLDNTKLKYSSLDNDGASTGSVYVTLPNSLIKTHRPDSTLTLNPTTDPTSVSDIDIGSISSLDYFYVYYKLNPLTRNLDENLTIKVNYEMTFSAGGTDVTIPYDTLLDDKIDICTGSSVYSPARGIFNIVHNNYTTTNTAGYYYNLPTQVANREGNFKIISMNPDSLDERKVVSTPVAVEMIDIGVFHDTNASCQDMSNSISPRIWLNFNNSSIIDFNKTIIDNSQQYNGDYGFYSIVKENVAFRVSYNMVDEDGTLIKTTGSGPYVIENYAELNSTLNSYNNDLSGDCINSVTVGGSTYSDISSACAGAEVSISSAQLAICNECVYGLRTKVVCSRDNFAIRPEAFMIKIDDMNQTNHAEQVRVDDNVTGVTSTLSTTQTELAAGYDYNIEINATNHVDRTSTPGYTKTFGSSEVNDVFGFKWNAASNSNCNDELNVTTITNPTQMPSFLIVNGRIAIDRNISQVGEYALYMEDKTWTNVDSDINGDKIPDHHSGNNYFKQTVNSDCAVGSGTVDYSTSDTLNGCSISSTHSGSYSTPYNYQNYDIEFHPYKFNMNGITPSRGLNHVSIPFDTDTFIYMTDMDFNNAQDQNMSFHLNGAIRAVGYNDVDTTNFVDGCYAKKVTLTLNKTAPTGQTNHTYRFININKSNTDASHQNNPGSPSSVFNNITAPTILLLTNDFNKTQAGVTNTILNINLDRNSSTALNPERVTYTTYTSRCTTPGNCTMNADLINTYDTNGSKDLNQTVNPNSRINITYLYGRTHASRQRYENNTGAANIYYEAYCFGTTGIAPNTNDCNKTLLPQGINSKRTDDIRWFINDDHNATRDGFVGVVAEKDAIGYVTATGASVANPSQTTLTYDANGNGIDDESYPYKTTMENNASRWLIYNENNPTATRNNFSVEFDKASTGWSGEHNTTTTTKKIGNIRTNRRSNW